MKGGKEINSYRPEKTNTTNSDCLDNDKGRD